MATFAADARGPGIEFDRDAAEPPFQMLEPPTCSGVMALTNW
jgi:hypothetical protein